MSLIFTGSFLSVPALIDGYFIILGVKVSYQQLLTLCAALAVMGVLLVFLFKTKLGLAIRSTAQDREVANLMGINEARLAMITMGISVGLAAFTGAIVVPLRILEPQMWSPPLIMMMAVVVLGGLGSLKGQFCRGIHTGLCGSDGCFSCSHGRFFEGFSCPFRHDFSIAHQAGRPLWRVLRGRKVEILHETHFILPEKTVYYNKERSTCSSVTGRRRTILFLYIVIAGVYR